MRALSNYPSALFAPCVLMWPTSRLSNMSFLVHP